MAISLKDLVFVDLADLEQEEEVRLCQILYGTSPTVGKKLEFPWDSKVKVNQDRGQGEDDSIYCAQATKNNTTTGGESFCSNVPSAPTTQYHDPSITNTAGTRYNSAMPVVFPVPMATIYNTPPPGYLPRPLPSAAGPNNMYSQMAPKPANQMPYPPVSTQHHQGSNVMDHRSNFLGQMSNNIQPGAGVTNQDANYATIPGSEVNKFQNSKPGERRNKKRRPPGYFEQQELEDAQLEPEPMGNAQGPPATYSLPPSGFTQHQSNSGETKADQGFGTSPKVTNWADSIPDEFLSPSQQQSRGTTNKEAFCDPTVAARTLNFNQPPPFLPNMRQPMPRDSNGPGPTSGQFPFRHPQSAPQCGVRSGGHSQGGYKNNDHQSEDYGAPPQGVQISTMTRGASNEHGQGSTTPMARSGYSDSTSGPYNARDSVVQPENLPKSASMHTDVKILGGDSNGNTMQPGSRLVHQAHQDSTGDADNVQRFKQAGSQPSINNSHFTRPSNSSDSGNVPVSTAAIFARDPQSSFPWEPVQASHFPGEATSQNDRSTGNKYRTFVGESGESDMGSIQFGVSSLFVSEANSSVNSGIPPSQDFVDTKQSVQNEISCKSEVIQDNRQGSVTAPDSKQQICSNIKDNSNEITEPDLQNQCSSLKEEIPVSEKSSEMQSTEEVSGSDTDNTSQEPVQPQAPPPKPKPSSWAGLFRSSAPTPTTGVVYEAQVETKAPSPLDLKTVTEKSEDPSSEKVVPVDEDPRALSLAEHITQGDISHAQQGLQPRGLINRGNWCYINATLQALIACPPFYNLLKGIPNYSKNRGPSSTPVLDSMVHFVHEFSPFVRNIDQGPPSKGRKDVNPGKEFEPTYVYRMLQNLQANKTFLHGRQEDAEEFLSHVLDGLHEEMASLITLVKGRQPAANGYEQEEEGEEEEADQDSWEQVGPKKKSILTRKNEFAKTPIAEIFSGYIRSAVFKSTAKDSATLQPYFTLQLDIQSDAVKTLKDALEGLVCRESISGYTCSTTKTQVEVSKRVTLEELPPVLLLHLKYFVYNKDGGCQKLLKKIDYSIDLDISKDFISPSARTKIQSNQRMYKLFAVVFHHGKLATGGGHYTAAIYHPVTNGWIHIDDHNVEAVSMPYVMKYSPPRVPYLLYYRRVEKS